MVPHAWPTNLDASWAKKCSPLAVSAASTSSYPYHFIGDANSNEVTTKANFSAKPYRK